MNFKYKNFIKLNFNTLIKIFITFSIGFISRSLVNYAFDINVFEDFTNIVSIIYYGCMAAITTFINGLPSITFNIFDFKLIKNAIKECCEKKFFTNNYYSTTGGNIQGAPGTAGNPQGLQHTNDITRSEYGDLYNQIDYQFNLAKQNKPHLMTKPDHLITFGDLGYKIINRDDNTLFYRFYDKYQQRGEFRNGLNRTPVMPIKHICRINM